MVKSPRPLQEKLALFWHGHFATQNSTVGNSYTMYKQNQLFREHAAGNFGIEQVSDTAMLDGAIQQMGQQLFEPLDVKGWRRGRAWISAKRMFARYNAMGELIRQVAQPAGRGIDLVRFLEQSDAGSTEQVVDYLAQACLATPLNTESRQKLIQFVDPLPPRSSWDQRREELNQRLRTVVILMMSLPEHQMS